MNISNQAMLAAVSELMGEEARKREALERQVAELRAEFQALKLQGVKLHAVPPPAKIA